MAQGVTLPELGGWIVSVHPSQALVDGGMTVMMKHARCGERWTTTVTEKEMLADDFPRTMRVNLVMRAGRHEHVCQPELWEWVGPWDR